MPASVTIVVHANDPHPWAEPHLVWSLARGWRERGLRVDVQRGPGQTPRSDLVIAHVDLSVVPQSYRDCFAGHPRVVNGRTFDIRKSTVHARLEPSLRVIPGDGYRGPVFVKTDRNFGGVPEFRLCGRRRWSYFLRDARVEWARRRGSTSVGHGDEWAFMPGKYPVYSSVEDVPASIWDDPRMIVTRLCRSRAGANYRQCLYVFFGSAGYCIQTTSTSMSAHSHAVIAREPIPVHPGAVAARRAFGLDYGKIDFVVVDGKAKILDVNKTPGNPFRRSKLRAGFERNRQCLIDGIDGVLAGKESGAGESTGEESDGHV